MVTSQSICLALMPVSYTHLRAHETEADLVCRLLLEKKERPSIAIGKAKIEKEKVAKAKTEEEENDSSEAASDSNEAES